MQILATVLLWIVISLMAVSLIITAILLPKFIKRWREHDREMEQWHDREMRQMQEAREALDRKWKLHEYNSTNEGSK